MSLYPTLEDLKCEEIFSAQELEDLRNQRSHYVSPVSANYPVTNQVSGSFLGVEMRHYLDENDKIIFSEPFVEQPMPDIPESSNIRTQTKFDDDTEHVSNVIADAKAYERKDGFKKILLNKNTKGKLGLQCRAIDNGVFISFVQANSPAAKAGLKFGDQILELNGVFLAGKSDSQIERIIKDAPVQNIPVYLRDRANERQVTLMKDSKGLTGFVLKNGLIIEVIKNSSAARNGLLTNHQVTEINGVNVIGLDDKTIQNMIELIPERITLTTIPKSLFHILIKKLGASQLKREMNRTQAEF